jgi:hypothetical protein
MTLDDIQTAIFQGDKGIKLALDIVEKYLDKHEDKKVTVSPFLKIAKDYQIQINPILPNQIKVIERYRGYFKHVVPEEGRIFDVNVAYYNLVNHAEHDSNERILHAKEPETKRNKEYEKGEVLRVLKNQYSSIIALFNLYNTLIDIKDEINKT